MLFFLPKVEKYACGDIGSTGDIGVTVFKISSMLELLDLSRLSSLLGSSLGGTLDSVFFDLSFLLDAEEAGEPLRELFEVSELDFSDEDGLGSATSLAFGRTLVSTTSSSLSPRPRRP